MINDIFYYDKETNYCGKQTYNVVHFSIWGRFPFLTEALGSLQIEIALIIF